MRTIVAGALGLLWAMCAWAQDTTADPAAPPPSEPAAEASAAPQSGDAPGSAGSAESAASEEAAPDASTGAYPPAMPETVETIPVEVAPPEAAPAAAAAEGPRQLEEIVVTAQKTTQSLQQVPLSVTAISKETIQYTGSNDLADLSLYVPNVRIDADDPGSPQIFIRGFGTNSFNPSFESSVGFVQDELYFGRPGYFTEAMFDIDRIEVLRGPQGTLFGKNTIAGVFNVASAAPTDEFEAALSLKGGSHGERAFEGAIGGPFADWGGARLSGLYREEDGELYNQFLDRMEDSLRQHAGRFKLKLFPTLNVSTELTLVDSVTKIPFWPYQLAKLDEDTRDYLEGFDPAIEDDTTDFRTSFDTPGWLEKGSTTGGLKTDWQIPELGALRDFHTVLVIGASQFYIDQLNEIDISPADLARLDSHEDHRQMSAELRFTGASDEGLFGLGESLEFVAGAFWFDSEYTLLARVLAGQDIPSWALTCDFQQLVNPPGGECTPGTNQIPGLPVLGLITGPVIGEDFYRFDYDQHISAMALFGQMTWYLSEHWAITPALRLNREEKEVDARGQAQCPGRATGRPCVMEQILESQDYDERGLVKEESDVSPKFVLQYFSDGGTNLYASYARGYKSGGFNAISLIGNQEGDPGAPPLVPPTAASQLEYEPEEAQTWEVGVKGKYFDNTLRLNLTLYQTEFDNLQVLAFNGFLFDVSNAGKAHSEGLELDFMWLTPLEWLSLSGSGGLLEARYDRYPGAPRPVKDPDGSYHIGETQDLAGREIAFAPDATATLTPTLTFPVGSLLLRLSADAIYQGDQYVDTDLDPNTFVPAYWKYAARAVLASQSETWAIIVGGNNLTDERVLNQVTDAPFFPGTYFVQQSAGRSLFATLSLRF